MKLTQVQKSLLSLGLGLVITGSAYGSAFQLFDQDASQLGNDYAGSIASANSPGTEYYNSAGMTHIKQTEMSFGATAISTQVAFDGSTYTKVGITREQSTGDGVSQGGGVSVLPNFHLVMPINNDWAFGFGITVPFGLETNYSDESTASMAATETSIRVINVGPSLAYRVNSWMSLGFGLDEQRAVGIFNQTPSTKALGITTRSSINNELSDYAMGWHTGMLFDLNKTQRIGINYRSKVNHLATGSSQARANGDIQGSSNTDVSSQIVLPPTTSIGFYDDVSSQWTLMTKADWTQWNEIQNITLDNVEVITPAGPTEKNINLPQNFRNTWNLAVGANYHINPLWTLKMGAGWDQSPVNNDDRNLRLPDSDHYIASTGISYAPNQNFTMDLGYEHIFLRKADINNVAEQFNVDGLNVEIGEEGNVSASADLIGAQITWKFM